jgi:hypothetical protein
MGAVPAGIRRPRSGLVRTIDKLDELQKIAIDAFEGQWMTSVLASTLMERARYRGPAEPLLRSSSYRQRSRCSTPFSMGASVRVQVAVANS